MIKYGYKEVLKMNKKLERLLKSVLCISLAVVMSLIISACGKGENSNSDAGKKGYKKLGEGENNFYLEIEKGNGKVSKYELFTDEVTVGAALAEQNMVTYAKTDKDETYISELDGKKIDFQTKKEFWALYYNGNYLTSNPDSEFIMCGDVYVMKIDTLSGPGISFPETKRERKDEDETESEEIEKDESLEEDKEED